MQAGASLFSVRVRAAQAGLCLVPASLVAERVGLGLWAAKALRLEVLAWPHYLSLGVLALGA